MPHFHLTDTPLPQNRPVGVVRLRDLRPRMPIAGDELELAHRGFFVRDQVHTRTDEGERRFVSLRTGFV